MDITIEALEKVMDETGAEYKEAKEMLLQADGDADMAIAMIRAARGETAEQAETADGPDAESEQSEANNSDLKKKADEVAAKVKALIEEGNVDRVLLKRGDDVLMNLPVNVGVIGGILGLAAAPWVMIAGAVAAYGFNCKIEIVKKDGSTDVVE